MVTLEELRELLDREQADYQLICQEKPIRSAQDAQGFYPVEQSAPTFILECDDGLVACIASVQRGRLDFEAMKKQLGYTKLKLADRKKIQRETGYQVGSVPLVGHRLPCIFDRRLFCYDYVYGGTGDELVTLKITPRDIERLNQVIFHLD